MATILQTTAQIDYGGTFGGLSTMYWLPGTPGGSPADDTDCLERFNAFWNAFEVVIATGVTVTVDPVTLYFNDATGALVDVGGGVPGTQAIGGSTGQNLPRQTQGMIKWVTAGIVNNRRVQGRTFMPAPTESNNTDTGTPDSSYVSNLVTAATTLLTPGDTSSTPVIWHRPVNNTGGSSHAITTHAPRTTWSVLRSRR